MSSISTCNQGSALICKLYIGPVHIMLLVMFYKQLEMPFILHTGLQTAGSMLPCPKATPLHTPWQPKP